MAGPDALLPFKDVAGAAAEVSVAFVVDFGGSSTPVVECINVPSGDNGYDALLAFTAQVGETAPVYNDSGLLCSINEIPANAPSVCGQQVSGGYDYWAYWIGTSGSWVYANSGAYATMENGDVEGWRYEDPGTANPSDPKPSASPDYASICGAIPASSTTTTTFAVPTTTTSIAAGISASALPPPSHSGSSGGNRSATTTTTAASASAGGPTTTTTTAAASSTQEAPSSTSVPSRTLSALPAADHQPGSGSPVPLIIGGLAIAALAGAALLGWRRRSRTQ